MPDLAITDSGDLIIDSLGDLAMVPNPYENYAQQAYIRMMTEVGDFAVYPQLGTQLNTLIGRPNTSQTADDGRQIILDSFRLDPVFAGLKIDVKAVPTGPMAIRFDIHVTAGSLSKRILSIEQSLEQFSLSGSQ